MKLLTEKKLIELADTPTIKIIDLWKSLTREKFGELIEILVGDRHEVLQLKDFKGELNTATCTIIKGQVKLGVLLDSFTNLDLLVVTHEIGHWVLKLKGFQGLNNSSVSFNDIKGLLNSLAHHPPLYELQKSIGHNPQNEIDSRTNHNCTVFSNDKELNNAKAQIQMSLILADDIMNCSKELVIKLRTVLAKNHPKTLEFVDQILDTASYYNLLEPAKNLKFLRRVCRNLKLGKNWNVPDEIYNLAKMLEEGKQQIK